MPLRRRHDSVDQFILTSAGAVDHIQTGFDEMCATIWSAGLATLGVRTPAGGPSIRSLFDKDGNQFFIPANQFMPIKSPTPETLGFNLASGTTTNVDVHHRRKIN